MSEWVGECVCVCVCMGESESMSRCEWVSE